MIQNTRFIEESLSFWNDLTAKQKENLQEFMVEKHFTAGEALKGDSEDCSGLFLLASGQVRAYIVSETGKEITLYRLFERDVCIFTASCLMNNISFEIFLEVEKETTAYLIPVVSYKMLSEESLPVMTFTNKLMAARFSEVMWIMEQTLFMSFDKRLAILLLEQTNLEESDILTITHEKIANHMGTAREVVTRMLKYFQNEGIVVLSRGRIEIIDRKKLEKMSF